jgi:hypothetical protein
MLILYGAGYFGKVAYDYYGDAEYPMPKTKKC